AEPVPGLRAPTPSALATRDGWVAHVAVTTTLADATASWVDEPLRGCACRPWTSGSGAPLAPCASALWAVSGSTRIASVRPTAWAGQRCRELGCPRYTAWRSKRTHTVGSAARLNTGQAAGTTSR